MKEATETTDKSSSSESALKLLLGFFKCSHPFDRLCVEKEHSEVTVDKDFSEITYHLHCRKCGTNLPLTHAKIIGGVDAFLARDEPLSDEFKKVLHHSIDKRCEA